ncbi:MAG: nucleotidyltransferase [Nitrospinae bacterium]|nr:nucleotidyltransferase [Nitrospinota bacterium]
MHFKLVLSKLLTDFEKHNIRYALMGGFALGAWGVPRTTADIDFLVNRDDIDKVDAIMRGLGYECRHKTENVSQYVSPLRVFGEVDCIHAFRIPSLSMLQRAETKNMFDETLPVKVLKVEDLIGFKMQAAANDESRKAVDMADIESLIDFNKAEIDWSLIEEYFSLFGFGKQFDVLRRKYSK